MSKRFHSRFAAFSLLGMTLLTASCGSRPVEAAGSVESGSPPVNLYNEAGPNHLSPAVAEALPRVYAPHVASNDVYVIDPVSYKVVDQFKVGVHPQHVVPSWDLRTLWVANNATRRTQGSLTPIDPTTAKPGLPILLDDPYNLYFTPDGQSAIVVEEARRRLDFRDPHTMEFKWSLATPSCRGINHADFAIDGSYAIFTREFDGGLVKIDFINKHVLGYLKLSRGGMPQDIRIAPDGSAFFVADMMADGVFVIDGAGFRARRTAQAAYRSSTLPRVQSWAIGPYPAVAVPTWAMSARMENSFGSQADSTMSSTCSTRPVAASARFWSATSRMASPSGRNRDGIRSVIPETCVNQLFSL